MMRFIAAHTNESYEQYVSRVSKIAPFTQMEIDEMWNDAYYARRAQIRRKS